jgi:hypothetical protein
MGPLTTSNINILSSFVSINDPVWLIGCGNPSLTFNILSSDDGSNWSIQQNPLNIGPVTALEYGSSIWLAAGNYNDTTYITQLQYSRNSSTWSNSTTTSPSPCGLNPMYDMVYASSIWVSVGGSGTAAPIQYSYDGISWLNSARRFNTAYGIDYGSTLWVAVGDKRSASSTIQYSYNSSNWSNATRGFGSGEGRGIAYGSTSWVAVGNCTDTQNSTIQYSYNGISWSNAGGGFGTNSGRGVAYGSSLWVAVGDYDIGCSTIQYSRDGISWSNATGGFSSGSGISVAYTSNTWVAVGVGPDVSPIQYSLDGMSWYNTNNWQYFKTISPIVVRVANTVRNYNPNGIFIGDSCSISVDDTNTLLFANDTNSVAFTDSLMYSLNAFSNIQI